MKDGVDPLSLKESLWGVRYAAEKCEIFLRARTSNEALAALWHISQLVSLLPHVVVMEIIQSAVENPDFRVRLEACYLARRWRRSAGIRLLEPLRSDSNSEVRKAAAEAEQAPVVFICYSHRDRIWLEKVETHLAPLVRKGSVTCWSDMQIAPGVKWKQAIKRAIADARVAVLLVSPYFLASQFIAEEELPPLLHAAAAKGLNIVWVPLSSSSYEETEIWKYQAAHDPSKPLDRLTEAGKNAALVAICRKIKQLVAKED